MFPDLLWFSFHRRILGCCPGACESPETLERELHPSSEGRGVRFICFWLLSHAQELSALTPRLHTWKKRICQFGSNDLKTTRDCFLKQGQLWESRCRRVVNVTEAQKTFTTFGLEANLLWSVRDNQKLKLWQHLVSLIYWYLECFLQSMSRTSQILHNKTLRRSWDFRKEKQGEESNMR